METFEQMLDEGLFDTIKGLSDIAYRARGKALAYNTRVKDNFLKAIGSQRAAGRLDANLLLKDLKDAFAYYCGQQGLKPTAMAVVEFLSTLKGESQLDDEDTWVKWLNGTPNLNIVSPNSQKIKSLFKKIMTATSDPVATTKAVAQIKALTDANDEDTVCANNWMRMLSGTRPEILRSPVMAPLLHLLDRPLDNNELNQFFTALARDMLRTKALNDMQKSTVPGTSASAAAAPDATAAAGGGAAAGQVVIAGINIAPQSARTDFDIPIGKPQNTTGKPSEVDLMEQIRKLEPICFDYIKGNNMSIGDVFLRIFSWTKSDLRRANALSARLLAILVVRDGVATASQKYHDGYSKGIIEKGQQFRPQTFIQPNNMLALCQWIYDGGNLDEVTAEFNAVVTKVDFTAVTAAILAQMVAPQPAAPPAGAAPATT